MVLIVGVRNVIIEIRSLHSVATFNSLWVNIVQAINFSNKEKGGLVQKKEQKRPYFKSMHFNQLISDTIFLDLDKLYECL